MANYVLCGELNINSNVLIKGNVYDVRNLSSLVKKLEKGGFRDIMELTNNKRTINNLEVDNLILVNFDCKDKSVLNVLGTSQVTNMEVLE